MGNTRTWILAVPKDTGMHWICHISIPAGETSVLDKLILEDLGTIESGLKEEIFAEKKVLVTGGAGFIGSWLCDVWVRLGAEVTAVDDFSTGRTENIDHLRKNQKFKLIKLNVSGFQSNEKFDFILHMAGHASPDEYQAHPIETLEPSSFGRAKMAELARQNEPTP